jgi:sugar O-acyltransferase (sialic acid O-acetyltransferase NeuD family)
MSRVVIFGNSQNAEIAHFHLVNDSEHQVVGFTVDAQFVGTGMFHGLPVVPFEELEKYFPPSDVKLFIPISYKKVNKIRAGKYFEAKERGYSFISYISSKAVYYNTPVGENCFILENNVIQPYSYIGNNCILWSGSHIGHHATIEDHCFISSQVVIAGVVTVGAYTFVGVNATLRDNIKIGKENVVGACSIVLQDTADFAVYSPGSSEKLKLPSNRLWSI